MKAGLLAGELAWVSTLAASAAVVSYTTVVVCEAVAETLGLWMLW